jgi:hypothetical protein
LIAALIALGIAVALLNHTSCVAIGAELPSLVCREREGLSVEPSSLKSRSYSSSALYRFTPKGLYLSDKDRDEYFYNTVEFVDFELGGGRFVTAHKTFIFSADFKSATAIHSNSTEVRVSTLICTRTLQ